MEKIGTDKITIRVPQKTKKQLEWLRKNGYGSTSQIVRGSGLVKHILDLYVNARKYEEADENDG